MGAKKKRVSEQTRLKRESLARIEPIYRTIGLKLRLSRERQGLNRKELSERVGLRELTNLALFQIENGKRRLLLHQALALADALGEQFFMQSPMERVLAVGEPWMRVEWSAKAEGKGG